MNWLDALRSSKHEIARLDEATTVATDFEGNYALLKDSQLLIAGIPSENGVNRVLEEWELPKKGWTTRSPR